MESTHFDVHDPEVVLRFLGSPLNAIWGAIDHGIQVADLIRDEHFGGINDSHYWSHCVRRGARYKMEEWERDADWSLAGKPQLSGLHVRHESCLVRVLKGIAGGGPPAPRSGRAINYYRQLSFDMDVPGGLNFLVDWGTDDERQPTLALSRPIAPWFFLQKPKLEWWCRIAPQGDQMAFVGSVEEGVLVASILDISDLNASGGKI